MVRQVCKECKAKWGAASAKKGPFTGGKKTSVAPWAVGEQASRKATALQAAITVLEEEGGCEEEQKMLSSKLEKERKVSTAVPSVHTQLVSVRGFIGRQVKRIEGVEAEIAKLTESKATLEAELAATRVKEEELEENARSELGTAPKPTGLE